MAEPNINQTQPKFGDTTIRDQLAGHLHTVEITGTTEAPQIKFTCHGDRDAPCHQYPACDCEFWNHDHEEEYGHPDVAHDECWMQPWFDADNADPNSETLNDCGYVPGVSGPVRAWFQEEYVAWEFITEPTGDRDDLALFPSPDGITITENPDRDNGYWRATLADGRSISFGRSIFRNAAELRAYIRRVFIEKEGQ